MIEIDGRLREATAARLDGVVMARLAAHVFGPAAEAHLRSGRTIDCSHAIGHALKHRRRFRCNVAAVQVAGGFGINLTMRVLPEHVPTFDELAIEPGIRGAWERAAGLTLVDRLSFLKTSSAAEFLAFQPTGRGDFRKRCLNFFRRPSARYSMRQDVLASL